MPAGGRLLLRGGFWGERWAGTDTHTPQDQQETPGHCLNDRETRMCVSVPNSSLSLFNSSLSLSPLLVSASLPLYSALELLLFPPPAAAVESWICSISNLVWPLP